MLEQWTRVLRLTGGLTAAFQSLLFLLALGYPSSQVSNGGMIYVAVTVVFLGGVALGARQIVALRAARSQIGVPVTLALAALAVGILLIGESSFGLITYGPLVLTLLALALLGGRE